MTWLSKNRGQIGGALFGPVGAFWGSQKDKARNANEDYFSQLGDYANTLRGRADEAYGEAGERPTYEIPDSVKQSLALMEELSKEKAPATADMPTLNELPGLDKIMNRIQSGQAGQVGAIKELGAGSGASIGAVNEIGRGTDTMMEDLAIENSKFKAGEAEKKAMWDTDAAWKKAQWEQRNKLNYAGALGQMGEYEDKEFQYNEADPYAINMNRGDMFLGAGDQAYYNTMGMQAGYANEQAQNSQDMLMKLASFGIQAAPML